MTRLPYTGIDNRYRSVESRRVKILLGIVLALLLLLFLQRRSHVQQLDHRTFGSNQFLDRYLADSQLHKVYAITPTYERPVQKAELTRCVVRIPLFIQETKIPPLSRISHVVQLSPNVHWIIVEDSAKQSQLVRNVISKAGIEDRTTVLNIKTPTDRKQKVPNYQQPRGVSQRNIALQWIRDQAGDHTKPYKHAAVFFMDDDNTYTQDLFREIAKIQPGRVGVWPVGLVGGVMVEKPLLDATGERVVGFNAQWRPERPFPLDMAGFAISLDLLIANPEAIFSYEVERGYQETEILRHVTTMEQLQPMANKCTEILVWHTRTEAPKLTAEEKLNRQDIRSDDGLEV